MLFSIFFLLFIFIIPLSSYACVSNSTGNLIHLFTEIARLTPNSYTSVLQIVVYIIPLRFTRMNM